MVCSSARYAAIVSLRPKHHMSAGLETGTCVLASAYRRLPECDATACTRTASILFVDRLRRCCTVCRSYNKEIDCALGSATSIDTVPRTSLLFPSTVPVSGREWECGAGECSPKSAAAPATVSGESYVIMPLGTSGPGKATRDEDPQARRPAVSRGHTRPCRPGCADVSRTASAWRDAGRLGSR
jgi:hypothetical protein